VVRSINKADHVRGDRIWFYAVGIGKEDGRDAQFGWPLKKFSTLLSESNDKDVSTTHASVVDVLSVRRLQVTSENTA